MRPIVPVETRVERLSAASLRRVIEPNTDVPGELGPGQVLPDELLSINGLDIELTPEQRATLSREEVASVFDIGLRFEATLMAGLCLELGTNIDLTDPRVTYALHEVGEETRHSRLFVRVIEQISPAAINPLLRRGRTGRWLEKRASFAIIRRPAFFNALTLGCEEIPDLIQKLTCEHPDTDPFLAAVDRYHRQEEARHLSFARIQVAERWERASWVDRFAVRYIAPVALDFVFHFFVHPGVYKTVGLPGWKTWRAVRRLPQRRQIQYRATRPVLKALLAGGALTAGRIPRSWRRLCNVDRHGHPVGDQTELSDA